LSPFGLEFFVFPKACKNIKGTIKRNIVVFLFKWVKTWYNARTALKKMLQPKKKVTEGSRKLHSEEFRDLYWLLEKIRANKSRKM
jgi:hypothetical protein